MCRVRDAVCRAGFCRFSCGQYSSSRLDDLTLHLTNIAIQKRQGGYNSSTGMKWPISSLRKYLSALLGAAAADQTFKNVEVGYPKLYFLHCISKICMYCRE